MLCSKIDYIRFLCGTKRATLAFEQFSDIPTNEKDYIGYPEKFEKDYIEKDCIEADYIRR